MHEHDVVGIGNAIVDIIGRCDDAFLIRHGYAKGSMQLVDAAGAARLYDAMGPAVEISGGSGANTFLGVSPQLGGGEVDRALVASARIVYLEGYLFDRPEAKAAFRQAASIAAQAGRQVALSLSDAFCVDRHRPEFLKFIRDSVDILFANEAEITSLYQTPSFEEAARRAQADTKLAVLTRSEKGSVILAADKWIAVPADPVAKVVDTTGAGDLYAAGFLFGLARGRDLETAARLGSLAAAEVISHLGARPETKLSDLARAKGLFT